MIDENKKNLIKLKVMAANSKDENSNIDSSVTQKPYRLCAIFRRISETLSGKGSVL